MIEVGNMIQDGLPAAGFGAMGLTCQLAWPMFRGRRRILAVQMGIGSSYAIQYALLDAWSGAGVAALGATQTGIALIAGDRPGLRRLALLFIPLVGAICWLTWSGIETFFASSACALIMVSRLQRDVIRLRTLALAAAPFGMGYDLSVGAVPALIGAMISATIGASVLIREIGKRRDSVPRRQMPRIGTVTALVSGPMRPGREKGAAM